MLQVYRKSAKPGKMSPQPIALVRLHTLDLTQRAHICVGYRVQRVIDESAIAHLARLPRLHRDPFDRMIVVQALQHDLTVVTVDDQVRAYPVPILPA